MSDEQDWISEGAWAEEEAGQTGEEGQAGSTAKSRGELRNGRLSQTKNHGAHNEAQYNEFVSAQEQRQEESDWP